MAAEKGEILPWTENAHRRRVMWTWLILLTALGIGFSALIVPAIIAFLIAANITYGMAFLIGLLVAIGLTIGLVRLLSLNAGMSDFIRKVREPKKSKSPLDRAFDMLYLLASVAALGLGIALCVYLAPVGIAALMLIGATHGFAVLLTIMAGVTFLALTASLLLLLNFGKSFINKTKVFWKAMLENKFEKTLGFITAAQAAGLGLGIYLAILVFPLLVPALTLAAVPHGLAVLAGLIVSIGLVALCHSLFLKGAVGLANVAIPSESTLLGGSGTDSVKSTSLLAITVPYALPQGDEDGATFVDRAILPHFGLKPSSGSEEADA